MNLSLITPSSYGPDEHLLLMMIIYVLKTQGFGFAHATLHIGAGCVVIMCTFEAIRRPKKCQMFVIGLNLSPLLLQ